jgi:GDPmannose 4,6-dehydratase
MPTALITGITGQDGSYLAEWLLAHGYRVVGAVRDGEAACRPAAEPLRGRVELVQADLADQASLVAALRKCEPSEVYNLAALSRVAISWDEPARVGDVTGLGVARLLEAVRRTDPAIRVFQAGSSEMFGRAERSPQDETTPFRPCTPYGAAKVYAHHLVCGYREAYGLFACSGILFNHESPRRGRDFVSRKIAAGAARIKLGLADRLTLGNLAARRDWGFAGDYVRAMWAMLQRPAPEDFVIGTGVQHTVEDFCRAAFGCVGLDHRRYVVVDPSLLRPVENDNMAADASKARRLLDWTPTTGFTELVAMMVRAEMEALSGAPSPAAGVS